MGKLVRDPSCRTPCRDLCLLGSWAFVAGFVGTLLFGRSSTDAPVVAIASVFGAVLTGWIAWLMAGSIALRFGGVVPAHALIAALRSRQPLDWRLFLVDKLVVAVVAGLCFGLCFGLLVRYGDAPRKSEKSAALLFDAQLDSQSARQGATSSHRETPVRGVS